MSILPHDSVRERDPGPAGTNRVPTTGEPDSASALAQRVELHLDLPDALLISLAVRNRQTGGAQ